MVSPGSEHAATSELSDATTAETTSFAKPVSDAAAAKHPHLASSKQTQQPHHQRQQQTVVIVEQPPTPATQPTPPTSLPLVADSQSPAAQPRSPANRLSPRQTVATVTSDSLPPVAEEDVIVADDNGAVPMATEADEVFTPIAGCDDIELDVKSDTGTD